MTKEDWIILRLLKGWVNQSPSKAAQNPDCVRTIQYLCNKHGVDKVCAALEQLPLSH
jgi:hypothetical protein